MPCIPPLLHDDKFITNFEEKAEIFNNFFAKQCSLIYTNSDLPRILSKKTHKSLSTVHFTSDDILICDASICKPLELIFRSCLENGKFPAECGSSLQKRR